MLETMDKSSCQHLLLQYHSIMYLPIIISDILKHKSSGIHCETRVAPVLWEEKVHGMDYSEVLKDNCAIIRC